MQKEKIIELIREGFASNYSKQDVENIFNHIDIISNENLVRKIKLLDTVYNTELQSCIISKSPQFITNINNVIELHAIELKLDEVKFRNLLMSIVINCDFDINNLTNMTKEVLLEKLDLISLRISDIQISICRKYCEHFLSYDTSTIEICIINNTIELKSVRFYLKFFHFGTLLEALTNEGYWE